MSHPKAWQPGQLLFAGFEGETLPPELGALIEEGRLGGIVLFGRNLVDPTQVRRLVGEIRARAPEGVSLTVAIDQEGGRVQRLRAPWTEWPPMRRLGEIGEPAVTRRVAQALARELTDLGIGLDFAPVVDVDTNPQNPVIGDRSFGRTAAEVSRHTAAFVEAMQDAGVAACAKHFPGHGDTLHDSHLQLPRVEHDLHRLREVEMAPFATAVGCGVASIMTAHVVYEAIDKKRPATLSPDVMAHLRYELGYQGLVFTDDLEMHAVAHHYRPREVVLGALEAGVDAMLACRHLGLVREVLQVLERAPDARVEAAIGRMVDFKARFPGPPLPEVDPQGRPPARPPYPEHERLADRLRTGDLENDLLGPASEIG